MYRDKEIFNTNLVYFLIICLFITIRIISSTFSIPTIWGYILNGVIQIGLMLSLPLFLFSYLQKQKVSKTVKDFGFNKIGIKTILLSFVAGIIVYLITIFVATFFSAILSLLGYENSSSGTVVSSYPLWLLFVELFVTAVLPGICEEVAHRGMLLNGYKKTGTKKAIILSGFLFGLMHLNIEQFFFASIIGIFFGFVAFFTDSIFPTMIMHFTNNAMSTFMGYASANNLPIYDAFNSFIGNMFGGNAFLSIMMMFLFILILVGLMYLIVMAMFKDTRLKNMAKVADKAVKEELRRRLMSGVGGAEEVEKDDDIDVDLKTVGNNKIFSIVLRTGYKNVYKPTFRDNIFLYVNLFLGIATTLSTFIWGVL